MANMTIRDIACSFGGSSRIIEWTIPYTDLTAAATTQTIALLPATQFVKGSAILGCTIKHSAAFTGTGPWTVLKVSVGSAALGVDGIMEPFDCFQTVGATVFDQRGGYVSSYSAEAINAYFTSVGGNLSVGLTGAVIITLDVKLATTATS